jgi:thiol-disulfide isomerase/thioredoxin
MRIALVALTALAVGVGAAAAAVLLVVTGDGRTAGSAGSSSTGISISGPPVRLSGTDVVSGKRIGLGKLAGEPVVVTVWASWCSPCLQQAEPLRGFVAKHEKTAFLAVDTQEDDEAARAFLDAQDLDVPTIADPDGRLAATLGVRELPTTLFLTGDHRIASRWEGRAGAARLRAGLAAAEAG